MAEAIRAGVRQVYRNGRYVALTRKQLAVLEVLLAADGGCRLPHQLPTRHGA